MRWQFGQFLLVMGVLALVYFYITILSQSPSYLFFCAGVLVVLFGGYVMWLGRTTPGPSERFSGWRKLRQKRDKKKSS